MASSNPWVLCVAPMMRCTDRHFRFIVRHISRNVRLYTEMVTTGALLYGERQRFMQHDDAERPLALQLGGSDPRTLAECARLGAAAGFDEINLNVGCPSDRVCSGQFGACLMARPELVADCVRAMRATAGVPVTVKTRIGIDDRDSYAELVDFTGTVAEAGCEALLVHARKAWLNGLSPRDNRDLPPLRYDRVYRLQRDFPELAIVLNGGVTNLTEVARHLCRVHGVMIGRQAYADPFMLACADETIFGVAGAGLSRVEVIKALFPYIERECMAGCRLHSITRHLLTVFHGQPGAKIWRRLLTENAVQRDAGPGVLDTALRAVERCHDSRAA